MSVLTRVSRSWNECRKWLSSAFDFADDFEDIAKISISVALETGPPLGRCLAEALSDIPFLESAKELYLECPFESIELVEVAATLSSHWMAKLKPTARGRELDEHTEGLKEAISVFSAHSHRMGDLRVYDRSLKSAELACGFSILRFQLVHFGLISYFEDDVAALNPIDFLDDVDISLLRTFMLETQSLDAFIDILSGMMRLAEAYHNCSKTTVAAEVSAKANRYFQYLISLGVENLIPTFAMSLNNYCIYSRYIGSVDDAVRSGVKSVSMYETISRDDPDYISELAMSKYNTGNAYRECGNFEQALKLTNEAISIREDLSRANADAHIQYLAMYYNGLGNIYLQQGLFPEASLRFKRAVDITKQLASAHPDSFVEPLSFYLFNLSVALFEINQPQEAKECLDEAIQLLTWSLGRQPVALMTQAAHILHHYKRICAEHSLQERSELLYDLEKLLHNVEE